MIDTSDTMEMVTERVGKLAKNDHTVNSIVSQLKKTIMGAVSRKGISVEESIDVAAKMVILASLVK